MKFNSTVVAQINKKNDSKQFQYRFSTTTAKRELNAIQFDGGRQINKKHDSKQFQYRFSTTTAKRELNGIQFDGGRQIKRLITKLIIILTSK